MTGGFLIACLFIVISVAAPFAVAKSYRDLYPMERKGDERWRLHLPTLWL